LFGTVPTVWSDRCLKVFEESAIIATLAKKTRDDAPCWEQIRGERSLFSTKPFAARMVFLNGC